MQEKIKRIFTDKFGDSFRIRSFFSPGKVNLIGEHIDYNGGFVFPCAISRGNYSVISLRNDLSIKLYSENYADLGLIQVDFKHLDYRSEHGWANYAKGIIKELLVRGCRINRGFNIAILGDLPSGAGLSSSASIEMLIAVMMNEVFDLDIPRIDLATLAKLVENQYMHVNCGIMDQFVIACGKKDHALLLNTETLEYTDVLLNLNEYDIVICNSMKKRGLAESRYNARRKECEDALAVLNEHLSAKQLCDISYPDFVNLGKYLTDPVLHKRARHVITENFRTLNAYKQLLMNDMQGFGESLLESHYSLKKDYEVSCAELDTLVELAMNGGSIGSRMTGAGFGGCTVNIVKNADFDKFKAFVQKGYFEKYGVVCDIFIANPEDGTKELQ